MKIVRARGSTKSSNDMANLILWVFGTVLVSLLLGMGYVALHFIMKFW